MYKTFTKQTDVPTWYIPKLLLIMRLTTVILIASIMQVSASVYGQRITLNTENVPLEQILEEIRKQSGYDFLYNQQLMGKSRPVSITLKNATIEKTLQVCFSDQPMTYKIDNKTVLLKAKPLALFDKPKQILKADSTFLVSGIVTNEYGTPLSGATVTVLLNNGTSSIMSTTESGTFKFYADKGSLLSISYMGYEEKQIRITKASTQNIMLQPMLTSLQEVNIVIGYGTTTQRLTTGSVAVVTSEDIKKQPVSNLLQALQNQVPGLVVTQNNGFSSSPFKVKIRGQNNLATQINRGINNNSEPLYILDGVPIPSGVGPQQRNTGIVQNEFSDPTGGQSPLFGLNPSDIESISILKDADATAIYGARGANGVILITTKKGDSGRMTIDANVYTGVSLQTKKLDLMNTQQYLEMRKRAFANENIEPEDWNGYDLRLWDQNRYTDWQKEFLSTAHSTDAQLSINGGDERTTFRLSGGFNRQTPPFKGDYKEQRASGSLSLNNKSFHNKLTTSALINFSSTTSNLPAQDPTTLMFLAPNAPALLDENGNLNFEGWRSAGTFPFSAFYLKRLYSADTKNLVANLNLNYEIMPGLNIASSFGYNLSRQKQLQTSPSGSFDPTSGVSRESQFGENNNTTWIAEPTVTWHKVFGKHTFESLLGTTFQSGEIDGNNIIARGFTSDAVLENMGAASSFSVFSNYAQTNFASLYSRISYNYDEKYIVNVNGRRDASSRFASGNQFGNFGSIGAAWIFTSEKFFKDHLKFLSSGKIRASYGLVGGDGLGDYQYLSSFSSGTNTYQETPVFTLNRLPNNQFSWTTNKKAEIALSLGFLNGRFNAEISHYRNRSGNQLVAYPLPATAGFTSVTANLPAVVQNSGWEVTLSTQNITTRNFSWSTNFNISRNSNKLLEFPDLENSGYRNDYAIERSISSMGMLKYIGVDPETGFYTFADLNGDGTVDKFGATDRLYKNTEASFFGGISNSLQYKDFQLSFFLSFSRQKGVIRLSNILPGMLEQGVSNQLLIDQQISGKPPLENLTTGSTFRPDLSDYYRSDAVWVDASYLRLQNLSVSYTLPQTITSKAGLQQLRLYVQGQNLVTFTGYKGTDPASPGSFGQLPPRKIITSGLQITF
ncbi:SusC/RagA family TonB-linked outer membrane protein [Pedobacter antarcticus]|uniref:SusC/RagA family TonB-linked outer membrane protein n=1 Tax=Pedobacter antarcticus TaxID=34086 RepID=UPI00292F4E43|nr:SusC/RagA family TonB-linked outer membrane protein [Pedobacter antarcticus]